MVLEPMTDTWFPKWPMAAILDFIVQYVFLDNLFSRALMNFYAKVDLCMMTWSQIALRCLLIEMIKELSVGVNGFNESDIAHIYFHYVDSTKCSF